jgi:hypothetical protein
MAVMMKAAETQNTATAQRAQAKREGQQPFFHSEKVGGAPEMARSSFFFNGGGGDGIQRSPFFAKPFVQTKLRIGPPDDEYEQQADSVADQVVQRLAQNPAADQPLLNSSLGVQRKAIFESDAEPEVRTKPIHSRALNPPPLQRKCAECEHEEELQKKEEPGEERETLRKKPVAAAPDPPKDDEDKPKVQRKCAKCAEEEKVQRQESADGTTAAPDDFSRELASSKGGGAPLPQETRSQMEGAIGADFAAVRIHTGSHAEQMSESVSAQAFTHGSDIYFNSGKYNPDSTEGQRLLGHELTHTVQQGATVRREDNPPENKEPSLWDQIKSGAGAAWDATGGAAINAVLDYLRPQAPNLVAVVEQIRNGGVINFFKTKLLQGINGIFSGLQNTSAIISNIFPQFAGLLGRIQLIVTALASGDCKPLFAAVNDLKEVVTLMAGQAWDAVVNFFQPAIDFFTDLWQSFALPAIEWLKAKAAHVWNWVQQIGKNIWDWFLPFREAVGHGWDIIKGIIGLNADETGEEGLIQWAERKVGEVWEMVKEEVRPIIEPARAFVAKVSAFIPLNAILNLRATIQEWLQQTIATSTAMGADASNVGNVAAQTSLRDQILPAIQQSIESFRGNITAASNWVTGTIGDIYNSVAQFFNSVRSVSILNLASGLIDWIETKANDVNVWVQS